jgi:hypothetical protein
LTQFAAKPIVPNKQTNESKKKEKGQRMRRRKKKER